jgi:hypothetical protein
VHPSVIDLPTSRRQLVKTFWLPVLSAVVGVILLVYGIVSQGATVALIIGVLAAGLSIPLIVMELRSLKHVTITFSDDGSVTIVEAHNGQFRFNMSEILHVQTGQRGVAVGMTVLMRPSIEKRDYVEFTPVDWKQFAALHPDVDQFIPEEFSETAFGVYVGTGNARLAQLDSALRASGITGYLGIAPGQGSKIGRYDNTNQLDPVNRISDNAQRISPLSWPRRWSGTDMNARKEKNRD